MGTDWRGRLCAARAQLWPSGGWRVVRATLEAEGGEQRSQLSCPKSVESLCHPVRWAYC